MIAIAPIIEAGSVQVAATPEISKVIQTEAGVDINTEAGDKIETEGN